MQRGQSDISGGAESAWVGFEERLELLAIAISPVAGIEPNQHVGEFGIHSDSSLLRPAWMNLFIVARRALRTSDPSAVMR